MAGPVKISREELEVPTMGELRAMSDGELGDLYDSWARAVQGAAVTSGPVSRVVSIRRGMSVVAGEKSRRLHIQLRAVRDKHALASVLPGEPDGAGNPVLASDELTRIEGAMEAVRAESMVAPAALRLEVAKEARDRRATVKNRRKFEDRLEEWQEATSGHESAMAPLQLEYSAEVARLAQIQIDLLAPDLDPLEEELVEAMERVLDIRRRTWELRNACVGLSASVNGGQSSFGGGVERKAIRNFEAAFMEPSDRKISIWRQTNEADE